MPLTSVAPFALQSILLDFVLLVALWHFVFSHWPHTVVVQAWSVLTWPQVRPPRIYFYFLTLFSTLAECFFHLTLYIESSVTCTARQALLVSQTFFCALTRTKLPKRYENLVLISVLFWQWEVLHGVHQYVFHLHLFGFELAAILFVSSIEHFQEKIIFP